VVGQTLLHYTVLERIGEGGMGVVYKGRDTHLDRFVALKVLPQDRLSSEDARRRFIQEAKSASALNHPNIVTVHDIAVQDGVTFIAMELVPGRTLGEIVPRQGLPIGRALNLAVQIADGLATAHKAGIIHRDLKPGNIMVSDEGRVKILDFGLAKLIERKIEGSDVATKSISDVTDRGLIVGTVGYMSPEQAEGAALDSRSDIFSFGVLLYEMVTGRRPFAGDTPLRTMSAILKDTPTPVSEAAPGAPRELERIIDRCLRKDPGRRWQHVEDVRIALLDLKEESDSGKLVVPVQAPQARSAKRWWIAAGAAAALAAIPAVWLMTRGPEVSPAADLVPVPLTTYRGDERDPTFSPDGTQVAFSWGPEGGVTNTYVKLVGAGDPIRLTNTPQMERMAQWSPDGKWIAFGRRSSTPVSDFVVMPALGGQERILARLPAVYCSWTPDSQWLLVADGSPAGLTMFSMHGGEKKQIVAPLQGTHPVVAGMISADGTRAAVIYNIGGRRPLYFVPLGAGYAAAGEPRAITPADWDVASLAWTPDGKDVITVRVITGSNLGGITAMYRISADGGTPKRLDFAGDNPWFLDVARRGNRLAYTRLQRDFNVYAAELAPDGTLQSPGQSVASSSRRDISPVYSPDGSRIAVSSDRDGSSEIWITASDGRNAVQLTNQGRAGVFDSADFPAWSPDGAQIVYAARVSSGGAPELFIVPASGGEHRRLTDDPGTDSGASWSTDGKTIYFLSNRGGGVMTVWSMPASGGPARQLSKSPSAIPPPIESPDGQWVYFRTSGAISRVRPSGADEAVVVKDRIGSGFRPTTRGLFYLAPSADLQSSTLRLVPLAGGPPKDLGTIPFTGIGGLSFTPDFTRMLYARCDQCAADLMLVENFR
jgi:Tol biopolymer transport system component/predicted Ser/Thr protein kinase